MRMEVTSRSADETVIFYIDGDLTTNSSPQAQSEMEVLLEGESKNIIINVEHVDFIASTGLRVILALGKRINADGRKLAICSMNATTKSVFQMSGFSKIFPTFETEEEALSAFSNG